jgi:hypothetical protein
MEDESGESRWKLPPGIDIEAEFVMAATDVPHESMPGSDHSYAAELLCDRVSTIAGTSHKDNDTSCPALSPPMQQMSFGINRILEPPALTVVGGIPGLRPGSRGLHDHRTIRTPDRIEDFAIALSRLGQPPALMRLTLVRHEADYGPVIRLFTFHL